MFDLFQRRAGMSSPQYTPPNWDYVRSQLRTNIQRAKKYFSTYPSAVAGEHILAKLITAVAIPMNMDLSRYYDNVDRVSLDVTMALFLTSSISFGRVTKGNFFGSHEIIVADFGKIDPDYVHDHWREATSVTVEYHPYCDIKCLLPEGKSYPEHADKVSVIKVNLGMLMVQYRAFCMEEEAISEITNDAKRTLYQFVRMHVLPNMLDSYIDHAILNRIQHLIDGQGMDVNKTSLPVALFDIAARLDQSLEQEISYYGKAGRDYQTLLNAIPLISSWRAIDLLQMPDIAPTQQVMWALGLSRLPRIKLLTLLTPVFLRSINKAADNHIVLDLKRIQSSQTLRRVLPGNVIKDVELEIDDTINLIMSSKP
jgi:hypothetical protein